MKAFEEWSEYQWSAHRAYHEGSARRAWKAALENLNNMCIENTCDAGWQCPIAKFLAKELEETKNE